MKTSTTQRLHQRFFQLPRAFYTPLKPTLLSHPHWAHWNRDWAEKINLPLELVQNIDFFAGNDLADVTPLAMKYAGHQFGYYNPDLGDGRGLLFGEVVDKEGNYHDLHVKGSGMTPYSRSGDGRAVLRSSIREYLCSEAMAGLAIPTTRALGLINSETPVFRETVETGALVLRTATTHIRFGHFEHFFYTNQLPELALLADKVIEWYMPECLDDKAPYSKMFETIVIKTAVMVAAWQANGFAHGVMNTDNMSILGETFDYGPFGFLDTYDPAFICNHSDHHQHMTSYKRKKSLKQVIIFSMYLSLIKKKPRRALLKRALTKKQNRHPRFCQ